VGGLTGLPGYWPNETSGVLAPVVRKYVAGEELEPLEVGIMRAYLRQWVAGDFYGPGVERLRADVDRIRTTADVHAWLDDALELGVDPL
jgi:hypothetical protein